MVLARAPERGNTWRQPIICLDGLVLIDLCRTLCWWHRHWILAHPLPRIVDGLGPQKRPYS